MIVLTARPGQGNDEHGLSTLIKRGASSQWSSSLYHLMRNSDKMTIEKMHPTFEYLEFVKLVAIIIKAGYKLVAV